MNNEFNADEIKARYTIYEILSKYGLYPQRNNMIACPFHNEKNASMKIYDNNTFHCFGCGADGDIFDFVQRMENCDFIRAMEIITNSTFQPYIPKKEPVKTKVAQNPQMLKNYIKKCHDNLSKTDYFYKRKLNKETQERFCLGYDEKYNSVVIPYNKELTYYQSRNVETKAFYKPNTDIAGTEPLFNQEALKLADCVFVVESPICALSIMQYGHNAIALCGVQGWKKLQNIEINKDCKLILCLDNDFEGKKARDNIINAFPEKSIAYNIASECKDANELLIKDETRFVKNLYLISTLVKKTYFGGNYEN